MDPIKGFSKIEPKKALKPAKTEEKKTPDKKPADKKSMAPIFMPEKPKAVADATVAKKIDHTKTQKELATEQKYLRYAGSAIKGPVKGMIGTLTNPVNIAAAGTLCVAGAAVAGITSPVWGPVAATALAVGVGGYFLASTIKGYMAGCENFKNAKNEDEKNSAIEDISSGLVGTALCGASIGNTNTSVNNTPPSITGEIKDFVNNNPGLKEEVGIVKGVGKSAVKSTIKTSIVTEQAKKKQAETVKN